MLKIYAGRIRKFNIGGLLPERLYAVLRVDLYGNTLAPFYEGYASGRVFLHNDWCEIRRQRDGRWRVYPLSAELAALLRANGVTGLPSDEELEPAEGDDGGWYPGYGGGVTDKDKDGNGDASSSPPVYNPEDGTGETPLDPIPSWHHCSIDKYYPDGIPKGYKLDPDWEPSVPTAEYTIEASCPLDPNFPSLVPALEEILGWYYVIPPEALQPNEVCGEGGQTHWQVVYYHAASDETIEVDELVCVSETLEFLASMSDPAIVSSKTYSGPDGSLTVEWTNIYGVSGYAYIYLPI